MTMHIGTLKGSASPIAFKLPAFTMPSDKSKKKSKKKRRMDRVEAGRPPKNRSRDLETPAPNATAMDRMKIPPLRELRNKYKAFEDHEELYQAAVDAYYYLGHILTGSNIAEEHNKATGSTFENLNPASRAWLRKNIGQHTMDKFRYIKYTSKYVETRIPVFDIRLELRYGRDGFNKTTQENYVKLIKKYFPNFTAPVKFGISDKTDEDGVVINSSVKPLGENQEVMISIESFAGIKPEYDHKPMYSSKSGRRDSAAGAEIWNAPKYFSLPSSWTKNAYNGIAFLDLKLDMDHAHFNSTYGIRDKEGSFADLANSLPGGNSTVITIPISGELVFRWPIMFALYATCCTKPSEFVPFMFYQYITWHRMSYGSKPTRGGGRSIKAPARVNHLGNIVDMVEAEKRAGRIIKPRTSKDGFVILGAAEGAAAGRILWVPDKVNRVSEYLSIIKGSYNSELNAIIIPPSELRGVGLLTDWNNEKFSYMLEQGIGGTSSNASGVATIDLAGSIPLDAVTLHRKLDTPLFEQADTAKNFASICDKLENGSLGFTPSAYRLSPESLANRRGLEGYAKSYNLSATRIMDILLSHSDLTWANLGGEPYVQGDEDTIDIATKNSLYMVNSICDIFREYAEDMLAHFDQLEASYHYKIASLRFILMMLTKYGKNYNEIAKESKAISALNQQKLRDASVDNLRLPNLTGIKTLMPHQAETFNSLAPKPMAAMLDISMGGGKSLLSIGDALILIHDKAIKRPIFIVPGNLVKNTINEVIKFSDGNVNPFAITLQTVRRINAITNPDDPSPRPNYEVLKKLIDSSPPNTIFVCNYRFLICDSEDIVYGNNTVTRHYAAEFLRDNGFDGAFIDESHFAKNLGSQQTQAAAIVISAAKYKRELSGTMVSDTLTDLVGQGSMINPAIFRTAEAFNNRYGLEVSGNRVNIWLPDAAKQINADLRPYVMRIIHKRQRWAFLLANMVEKFYPVEFTPKQKEFYNNLLQEAIEKIQDENPKLWAKLQTGDEKEAAAIEQGLATYFQAVEQFVYAPDSNTAFVQLEGIEDEDLVSPKVSKVIDILDKHFAESRHKVLIFSYRKQTSVHIMKHLPEKYKRMAAHYTAGDDKVLAAFQKNDKLRILVADEKSINTGQNLQVASRLIRLETLWSPGDQDQGVARMWRPEFTSAGEGKKDRPTVYMDWIFTNNSLEVAKIGRLISKIVEKVKFDRQEDPRFTKEKFAIPAEMRSKLAAHLPYVNQDLPVNDMLESLKLIKMNTASILTFNNVNYLKEYFATYTLVNLWEDMEFEREKQSGTQKLIQVPKSAYVTIQGSKRLNYLPRVPGVDPSVFDPENKFEYKPISILDMEAALNNPDADEDDEKYIEVNSVAIGDLVDTEFGFGHVVKMLQNDIWVEIAGIGKIKVPKATAWLIGNEAMRASITKQLRAAGKRGMPRFPGSIIDATKSTTSPVKKQRDQEIEEEIDKKVVDKTVKPKVTGPKTIKPKAETAPKYDREDVDVEDNDSELEIFTEIVDGHVALTCFAEDADSDALVDDFDFSLLPAYTAVRILGPKTLDGVLKVMEKFKVTGTQLELLEEYRPYLANKSLDRITPKDFISANRFLNVGAHRRLKPDYLRPLPMVWGKTLYLCFVKDQTPSLNKFLMALRRAHITNLRVIDQQDLHVKLYPTASKAIAELKRINNQVSVINMVDTIDGLRSVKALRTGNGD